jgi:cytochrome b6-f complex iron-sulfur subunit
LGHPHDPGIIEVKGIKMPALSRRDFLKVTTRTLLGVSGLLGLGGLIRFLSYEPAPPPPKRIEVGLTKNYPIDSRTVLPAIPALLVHNADGFSAISLICTHLGCTVEAKSKEFVCPCHGSRYDTNGKVTLGPASESLEQLKVEITADNKIIVLKS